MARHRKRPAPRHQARGREGRPGAHQAPDRRLGLAMRRVVVTPTFAAGLGVVVAAVLAYPMRTVFSYAAPGGGGLGGIQCGPQGCTRSHPTGKPVPQGGGILGPSPAPARTRPAATPAAGGGASSDADSGGGVPAQPQLSYRIARYWQGGFSGLITIKFPSGSVPATWRLRFGYPGGQIVNLSPKGHLQSGGHGAVVRSADYTPGGNGTGGGTFAVSVGVRGKPARPAHCAFNGEPCRIH
jgi:Cellulose binding domain